MYTYIYIHTNRNIQSHKQIESCAMICLSRYFWHFCTPHSGFLLGKGLRCRENLATAASTPMRQAMQNDRPPNTVDLGRKGSKMQQVRRTGMPDSVPTLPRAHMFCTFFAHVLTDSVLPHGHTWPPELQTSKKRCQTSSEVAPGSSGFGYKLVERDMDLWWPPTAPMTLGSDSAWQGLTANSSEAQCNDC